MYEIGDDKKGPVLYIGKVPSYKRPAIGVRNGSVYTTLGWFRNEQDSEQFLKALCEVFNLKIVTIEEEEERDEQG